MSVLTICLDETADVCFEAKTLFIARCPWSDTMKEKLVKFLGISETTKDDGTRKAILQMLWTVDSDTYCEQLTVTHTEMFSVNLENMRDDFQANYFLSDKFIEFRKWIENGKTEPNSKADKIISNSWKLLSNFSEQRQNWKWHYFLSLDPHICINKNSHQRTVSNQTWGPPYRWNSADWSISIKWSANKLTAGGTNVVCHTSNW
jgi:hypothetical protein